MASIESHTTNKGERRYTVRFRDPAHRQQQKTFQRKVDAEHFRNAVEASKDQGTYIDARAGKTTLSVMVDRWLATRIDKARSTQDRDRSYLRSLILPTFGERSIKSIAPSEIEAWLASMRKAPNTRGRALQILRSVLDLARRDQLIASNPAADVKPPQMKPLRTGRALADDETNAIISAAEEVDERTAVVVHLMARCGLRVGEALALRRRDVDLDAKTITVATSMSRQEGIRPVKGRTRQDQGRVIPIPSDVAERLRRHFDQRAVTSIGGFVVTAPRGGPLGYTNWRRRVWTKIVERVGLDVTPHDLRRTAATRLFLVDRWTPAEVQAYLGHLDPRVTLAIYALVESEELPQPSTLDTGVV
jgi:integrase